jgi:hypothetical protein
MCLSLTEIPLSGCITSFILLSCSQASKYFPKEFPFFFFPFEVFSFEISTCYLRHHLNVASISGFCWRLKAIKISKEFPRMRMNMTRGEAEESNRLKTTRLKISQSKLPHAILIKRNHNKSFNRQLVAP